MIDINNNIITMNRGDTFSMPLHINIGTKYAPEYYTLEDGDEVYFALEEYNQPFEFALIRKVFNKSNLDGDGNVLITLSNNDTQCLLPGEYYYEIKLKHVYLDENDNENEVVDTIVPRRKFIIIE